MLRGLLSFPAARRGGDRVRLALDLAVVSIGASAVVVYVVLGPTAVAGSSSALQAAFSIAYPVGDVVLLFGFGLLLLRRSIPSARRALAFLAASLALYVAADLVYGYVTLHSGYQGGDRVDLLYMAALALRRRGRAAGTGRPAERLAQDAAPRAVALAAVRGGRGSGSPSCSSRSATRRSSPISA